MAAIDHLYRLQIDRLTQSETEVLIGIYQTLNRDEQMNFVYNVMGQGFPYRSVIRNFLSKSVFREIVTEITYQRYAYDRYDMYGSFGAGRYMHHPFGFRNRF